MTAVQVEADLEFSVTVDGREMSGSLRGSGTDLELSVSDPYLLGGSGTAVARAVADQLAGQGLQVTVVADRPLVTLGVARVARWQRRISGSAHIAISSPAAMLRILRLRRQARHAPLLVPPPSPLPLLPTFLRRPRKPTLTHDPDRGGYPRLVLAAAAQGRPRTVFALGSLTTIGSDASCDVVLPGLDPLHAEVRWTEDDELVLFPIHIGDQVRVNGGVVRAAALMRTGTRVELGGWTLIYGREEYADHGRPYGGRIGGELGYQRPQPPREHLQ